MSKGFRISTLALMAGLIAAPALAQDAGYYVGAGIGLTKGKQASVTGVNGGKAKFDRGFMGAVSLGYDYASPWRGELELSRRGLPLDSVSGAAASGEALATAIMGNALYDFDLGGAFSPYLGAGLGLAQVDFNNAQPFGATSINDGDTALAYQAIAGVSYAIQDNLDLFADYRYFATRGLNVTTAAATSAKWTPKTHNVLFGLRYSFGAPAPRPEPMPVAAPAPAPEPVAEPVSKPEPILPRTFLVFFDWDKADITAEANAIIQAAAQASKETGVVRVDLTGHADTSGTQAYNMGLSQRRADAVKAAFVALGLTANDISTVAKGETDPLVATGDGVREPQNRRVEIVLD